VFQRANWWQNDRAIVGVMESAHSVGDLLREWRQRRRISQLDLATDAGISSKHLCFVEKGRSQPSREMLLRLAEHLQIPLRGRNVLLNAAGYAAVFPERQLAASELAAARKAMEVLLEAHKPYPAIAFDRHWRLVASNGGLAPFLGEVDSSLLQPPVNVLRLSLHPRGLATRLANYGEWRAHVLDKVRRQIEISADQALVELHRELSAYPLQRCAEMPPADQECHCFVVPFRLMTGAGVLSFFSTTTVFGNPVDVTLSELSLESFYPADASTERALRDAAAWPKQTYLPGN
jgi:transcriptional regulator with XRE-family HTH domain